MNTCESCDEEFLPAFSAQEYCSRECRKKATKKPPKRRPHIAGFEDTVRRCRVTGCNDTAGPAHHVVYQQHLDDYGGDPGDSRNALSLCPVHHERHHKAARRVKLAELRPENLEFARELLGPYADDYIATYYDVIP